MNAQVPATPIAAATADSKVSGGVDLATLLGEPPPRAWYARRIVWASAAAAVLLAGGAWWWYQDAAARAPATYSTQQVTRGNLTLTVTANGTVQPTRSISIGSELSGTVLQVNVDVNDVIRKGQVLVVLDTAKLRDQVRRSQAALSAAS